MSWRFHAAAPPGEWINDPNALFFADGRYRLLVQHAADTPHFRRIGWGQLSSRDLLDWRWEGVAMPPEPDASVYSGSLAVVRGERRLFFTRHEPAGPWQSQRTAVLAPDRRTARAIPGAIGPAGRNVRDPFVWRAPQGWRMLVARPCDWTGWRDDPPSTLELWGSADGEDWDPLATVGPWMEPGVMWEVPAAIDFGEVQALLVSLVDRRRDAADCSVRYWLGRMDDNGFVRAPGFPAEGAAADHGPDFYAAIPNVAEGWPIPGRAIVGWASSWATARAMPWPERRGGGPIGLVRRVELAGDRLRFSPCVDRAPDWVGDVPPGRTLRVARGGAALEVAVGAGSLRVTRHAPGLPAFERESPVAGGGAALLHVDEGLVELFLGGETVTAMLPGGGGCDVALRWTGGAS